jgi:hypothetical protein
MSKRFFEVAFALGLVTVVWVAWGFMGTHFLALAMTALIAGVYLLGGWELRQFRAMTSGLSRALADLGQPPARLDDWLAQVPAPLRTAVRVRVEGQARALPGPALTPYLVGLLVMLGMLGTFLGMVLTFKGAVFALEGSADLQALRGALAEPIKGLGLSFGTSVAGVAASAMLGLMSAMARRERLQAARQLDASIAGVLRPFSPAHQREASLQALQAQAGVLPQVLAQMEGLMARLDARGQQLDAQLLERHERLQRATQTAYTELATSVGSSLERSLAEGVRAAGQSLTPVVADAMAQVVQQSERLHARLGELSAAQVGELSQRVSASAQEASRSWQAALAQHERSSQALSGNLQAALGAFSQTFEERSASLLQQVQSHLAQATAQLAEHASEQAQRSLAQAAQLLDRSEELVRGRVQSEAQWHEQQAQRMEQLAQLWRSELAALHQAEDQRGQAALERLGALEAAVAQHLAQLGASLEAPLSRLLHTASEVPQAAAGVIAQLRQEMSRMAERDNLALEERTTLIAQLHELLQAVQRSSGEQSRAVEALVDSAGTVMQQAGQRFAELLDGQAAQAGETAAQLGASAVELASLGEAFGQGVQQFQAGSDQLLDGLQRIEAALARSTARSDEQLAYYVAQARELIDLSISSQQGILEGLQQLKAEPLQLLAEGARA